MNCMYLLMLLSMDDVKRIRGIDGEGRVVECGDPASRNSSN